MVYKKRLVFLCHQDFFRFLCENVDIFLQLPVIGFKKLFFVGIFPGKGLCHLVADVFRICGRQPDMRIYAFVRMGM